MINPAASKTKKDSRKRTTERFASGMTTNVNRVRLRFFTNFRTTLSSSEQFYSTRLEKNPFFLEKHDNSRTKKEDFPRNGTKHT